MALAKTPKAPEFARWKYKIRIDVEETKSKAQNLGFSCRLLEGQPKNKRGQDGWGEPYSLGQYEITGGDLPPNAKIHISPKTTQIFFFGPELTKPTHFSVEEFERFLIELGNLMDNLEKTEKLMNDLASFISGEDGKFGKPTRVLAKVPATYRLLITSEGIKQELLDDILKKFYDEIEKTYADMFQGNFIAASRRLDELFNEAVFFQRSLIQLAKDWKDPNALKWEDDLNNSLMFPFGSGRLYKKNWSKPSSE